MQSGGHSLSENNRWNKIRIMITVVMCTGTKISYQNPIGSRLISTCNPIMSGPICICFDRRGISNEDGLSYLG